MPTAWTFHSAKITSLIFTNYNKIIAVRVSEADGVFGGGAGRHLPRPRRQNSQQRRRNLLDARRQAAEEQFGALQVISASTCVTFSEFARATFAKREMSRSFSFLEQ